MPNITPPPSIAMLNGFPLFSSFNAQHSPPYQKCPKRKKRRPATLWARPSRIACIKQLFYQNNWFSANWEGFSLYQTLLPKYPVITIPLSPVYPLMACSEIPSFSLNLTHFFLPYIHCMKSFIFLTSISLNSVKNSFKAHLSFRWLIEKPWYSLLFQEPHTALASLPV